MLFPLASVPALKQVDSDIFTLRYFGHCMRCSFCNDGCCQWGCDVNVGERDRILGLAAEIAPFVEAPVSEWFMSEVHVDPEYPSGKFVRTQRKNEACVFLNRGKRGCGLHTFALATGRDYHDVKPMVCWLFPVCWDQGVLRPSSDIRDELICKDQGEIVYDMVRDELAHVFGPALIAELDAVRSKVSAPV